MFSDDPQRQALMMLAAGLLSPVRNKGAAGFGEAMSRGIRGGLLGYNQAREGVDRKSEMEMRRQFQQRQLEEMDRAAGDNAFMRQAAGQFFKPGNAPADGMGPTMPPSFDPAGFGAALASRGMVREAAPFLPKPEAPKAPIKLGQNERLIDPNTFKETVSAAPENWQNPEWVKTQMAIRAAGAPRVQVDTKQEDAFSKEWGKNLAENYGNLMKADVSANTTLNNLSRLESLLKSGGNTGKLTPAVLELKKAAASLGFEVDDKVPFQDAARALSAQMALELRNPAGGAGMPGALSDKDREFLISMTAGIDKMPNANALIIETRKRLAMREKQIAKIAREYKKKAGRFDEGFNDVLAEFSANNPLFGDLTGAMGQAAPAGGFSSPEAAAVFEHYTKPGPR